MTSQWQNVTLDAEIPSGKSQVSLGFRASRCADIDDVQIVPANAAENSDEAFENEIEEYSFDVRLKDRNIKAITTIGFNPPHSFIRKYHFVYVFRYYPESNTFKVIRCP